ncbi:helix-turn-helix domain-containing protein [Sulfurospirillum multivorans]|uniref:HTH_XRE protein n=2 Tax=Sulfurospirillum multivorans TaxID=66821 RepID=A0AA86ANP9_SULMK|nr:transcriptional regulator [Sulfurospirillum multivorans]AHJ13884.1 HTH_XRE protein [Sulfurospirillum multivorans DSM 12446]QEH07374.1 HTH_XRE protein [Sulfurospirillum multivorans]
MNIQPIKTEMDYEKALERVDVLMEMNPEIGTPQSDELEILALLIEKYEEKYWAIATPDPIEAIKYRMEELGLKQKDLVPMIGSKSKVSEVLNRKIGLSLSMIAQLSARLHIPLEVLVPKVLV